MRITIKQFQELYEASKLELTELDQSILMVKILTGKTDYEIDKMKASKFNKLCAEIKKAFDKLNQDIDKEKPQKIVRVKGKYYLIHYELHKLSAGRYVDVATYSQDIIPNLHKIMASIVTPLRWTWKGLRAAKYDGSTHSKRADEFLNMDFSIAYHVCVFFYAVTLNSIKTLSISGNSKEAKILGALQKHLVNYLDGTITASWYQSLKHLH